ncbi:recombinase family protein [Bradyrhizobium sp. G127]|uniref:recombinase family protein n=1 Tax=Bradyrhizobium sp. G127 TaxID=2904800 RepID=UPI001F3CD2A2|nr:recombinase family protein [Bradyrhizobium sp. G127]MCF2525416.1 recombinase family protein [Bradyrhizobium sp. G127]
MIYGYARVSTCGQSLNAQLRQLRDAGCNRIYREHQSGATADRPQLKRMLRVLKPGDLVIISAVDRLSRDTTDLLVLARQMQQAGAGLKSLAEPLVNTTSEFSDLVLAVLGLAAKFERRRMMERTARGRAEARANGVKFGRPSKLSPMEREQAICRRGAGESISAIAKDFNVSHSTISRIPTMRLTVIDYPSQVGQGTLRKSRAALR